MKKFFWTIVCLIFAGGALAGVLLLRSHKPVLEEPVVSHPAVRPDGWLTIDPDTRISVDVSDTEEKREQGLSGRQSLAEGYGMLFFFDTPGQYQFWMKDMLFSIDIVWLSSDWKVVDITHNLSPETYPNAFGPQAPAQYVLEVPAGYAKAHAIKIGQSLSFEK